MHPDHKQKTDNKIRPEETNPFKFECYPGISCFTQCCRDITIVLTPYDVLRLKKGLEINSDEFLERYTLIMSKSNRLIPLVILKMNEPDKKWSFATDEGCTVYNNDPRGHAGCFPWISTRMERTV
jgi:Fe-S-cluster containining protein